MENEQTKIFATPFCHDSYWQQKMTLIVKEISKRHKKFFYDYVFNAKNKILIGMIIAYFPLTWPQIRVGRVGRKLLILRWIEGLHK